MSSPTWTPRAVASSAAPARFALWRAVEAQRVVSTMALVDTLEEQAVLEQLLDASKPPVPAGADKLHYLLFTPFRYGPPPGGSRFRAPTDAGVIRSSTAAVARTPTPPTPRLRFIGGQSLPQSSCSRFGPGSSR